MSIAIPPHIGICASARSTKVGAAALASEPSARSALPTPISARGEKRPSARPVASATTAASGAARIRNCPACSDRDTELGRDVAQDRRHDEHARLAREQREEEHDGRRREGAPRAASRVRSPGWLGPPWHQLWSMGGVRRVRTARALAAGNRTVLMLSRRVRARPTGHLAVGSTNGRVRLFALAVQRHENHWAYLSARPAKVAKS